MFRIREFLKLFILVFFTVGVVFLTTLRFMADGASFLVAFCLALVLDLIILPVVMAVRAQIS